MRLTRQELSCDSIMLAELPPEFADLAERSLRLQARVMHLDRSLAETAAARRRSSANPLAQHFARVEAAFRELQRFRARRGRPDLAASPTITPRAMADARLYLITPALDAGDAAAFSPRLPRRWRRATSRACCCALGPGADAKRVVAPLLRSSPPRRMRRC